jgi:hypothetical protein
MGANDLRSSIKDYIEDIEDVNFLEAICTLVQLHGTSAGASDDDSDIHPANKHSASDIEKFEDRDDFWGYDIDGKPVYGNEVHDRAEETLAAADRGEIKLTTHEEFKAKMEKKRSEWQSHTK